MFGKAANHIVIDGVDRDIGATKPSREVASRSRVALNGQRRVTPSGKVGREPIDHDDNGPGSRNL